MHRTRATIALTIALAGCGGGSEPVAQTDDAGPAADAGDDAQLLPQVLAISKVDVYQAVQVTVAKDGARIESRNAPLVANREALVRVSVKPGKGWARKRLEATLNVTSAKGTTTLRDSHEIGLLGSNDTSLDTTFNFQLEKGVVTKDATFDVTVATKEGESLGRYPTEGGDRFDAVDSGTLKVKLVPVKYDADGSGRTPSLDEDAIALYRSTLYAMYPLQAIEISTRDAFAWADPITADGNGWDTLLGAIVDLRNTDKTPSDVYYYGLFEPTDGFGTYCKRGCVAGLSGLVSDPRDAFQRGSIGLGYPGNYTATTMAHEIGHAHGRAHAPCGDPAGIDKKFPYDGGETGVFGWHVLDKELYDAAHTDVMGYCPAIWISDYTYRALYDRVAFVNGAKSMLGVDTSPHTYRLVHVRADGSVKLGQTTVSSNPPMSDPRTVTYEGDDGAMHTLTGHWYPYGDVNGGLLVVPETATGMTRVQVAGVPALERLVPIARGDLVTR